MLLQLLHAARGEIPPALCGAEQGLGGEAPLQGRAAGHAAEHAGPPDRVLHALHRRPHAETIEGRATTACACVGGGGKLLQPILTLHGWCPSHSHFRSYSYCHHILVVDILNDAARLHGHRHGVGERRRGRERPVALVVEVVHAVRPRRPAKARAAAVGPDVPRAPLLRRENPGGSAVLIAARVGLPLVVRLIGGVVLAAVQALVRPAPRQRRLLRHILVSPPCC